MHAQIPLLFCLSIVVLSLAKLLSKTFQSEDVDTISTASLFEQSRQQLLRIGSKDYFELLPLKRLLIMLKRAMTTYTIFRMSLLQILKMQKIV